MYYALLGIWPWFPARIWPFATGQEKDDSRCRDSGRCCMVFSHGCRGCSSLAVWGHGESITNGDLAWFKHLTWAFNLIQAKNWEIELIWPESSGSGDHLFILFLSSKWRKWWWMEWLKPIWICQNHWGDCCCSSSSRFYAWRIFTACYFRWWWLKQQKWLEMVDQPQWEYHGGSIRFCGCRGLCPPSWASYMSVSENRGTPKSSKIKLLTIECWIKEKITGKIAWN